MCITKACEEPTSAGVWWGDDAQWKQYNTIQAAAILQGVKAGAKRVELGNLVSPKYGGGAGYVVDLTTMKQLNLATGYTRDVKVIPALATAATPGKTQRSKELEAVLESILSLKKVVEDLLAVKDQATRNEQVVSLQTSPEQTNQVAELTFSGPQEVVVKRRIHFPIRKYYSDSSSSSSEEEYY